MAKLCPTNSFNCNNWVTVQKVYTFYYGHFAFQFFQHTTSLYVPNVHLTFFSDLTLLKVKAITSFEMEIIYKATRRHMQEDKSSIAYL